MWGGWAWGNGRPASFFFAPADGSQYQILQKIPPVRCAGFDGSTYGHPLEEFREGYCSMAEYSMHGGRAVQVYNSVSFLEITCRICRAMPDGTLGYDMGCWLFQLVFTQTGWFLLDAGMSRVAEGNLAFVARSPECPRW